MKLLYDAGVRIGTTLDVKRTAEELAEVAVPRFADVVTVELLDSVLHGEESSGMHTEMHLTAVAGLDEDHLLHPVGELIHVVALPPRLRRDGRRPSGPGEGPEHLRRPAGPAPRRCPADPRPRHSLLLAAPLRARGSVLGVAGFWRANASPPFEDEDVSIAEELAARAAVCIDNARRYTREHTMAVTLQRSLLPHAAARTVRP